ncbi:MAG: lamin tail domain-containing protein [Candidatus Saccharibacteria bacterium]|nr:lamin tail domain-containing protein [Candidatus Saccharibacteria bacterium]
MKNKIIFAITTITAIAGLIIAPVFAEEGKEKPLLFHAVNAGYKDEQSAQNYDFFEIAKSTDGNLDLSPYKIQYFNSSDNLAGELEFAEPTILQSDSVVFSFGKSPQYLDASQRFLYNFGTAGLASTAGRLKILLGEEMVDEICWGKTTCENNVQKFATDQVENYTALRGENNEFIYEKYYPAVNEDAFLIQEPEPEQIKTCNGLMITEIYSYYEESSSEQFIELYNSGDEELTLDSCILRYKGKDYPLLGILAPKQYTIVQDLILTKDPSSELVIEILDGNGLVDSVSYTHGQKKGVSIILVDGQ